MKGALGRAAASAVANGRPRTVIGWLGGWRTRFRDRGDDRFQSPVEPFPRHWRAGQPHPPAPLDAPHLHQAINRLPATWRAVLIARDVEGLGAADVAARLDLSPAQQRRILNHARAALRDGGMTR